MQGKVTSPHTMVGHFCEFGKNFGRRSASMQGKVTFPRTKVGLGKILVADLRVQVKVTFTRTMAALLLKFFIKLAQMAQVSLLVG